MIKIGVLGATGRMGNKLLKAVVDDEKIELSAAIVREGNDLDGHPVPFFSSVSYGNDLKSSFQKSDVMIDFTLPQGTREFLKIALETSTPLVIGTTGLSQKDHELMIDASKVIPIIYGTNMSLGVNILNSLVEKTAAILGDDFDIEILEMHHRYKKDAPSGTALTLGEFAAKGREKNLDDIQYFNHSSSNTRRSGDIGFASLRGGGVFGDHQALFASNEEVVTLSHRALNRSVFAKGAVISSKWIISQKPGFYTMRDVLAL